MLKATQRPSGAQIQLECEILRYSKDSVFVSFCLFVFFSCELAYEFQNSQALLFPIIWEMELNITISVPGVPQLFI